VDSVPHRAIVRLLDAGTLADEALAPYAAWLQESERQRLDRFVRPARRRQFLAGRILARHALGEVLGVAARSVRLEDRPGAAPVLVSPRAERAGFSISHSGRWVACAASASTEVGLDIEIVDAARDIDALAVHAFDAAQQAWLTARPAATRVHDFYALWSSLEARFKLGVAPGAEYCLSTPELSIVLCAGRVLDTQPNVEVKTLPTA
jgi:4'-phosphopantetheinyl transferase